MFFAFSSRSFSFLKNFSFFETDNHFTEKIISSLLDALSAEHRAVIVLREIEGLSYEDIAQSLKINLNTVRSRLKRAREALLWQSKKAVQNEL